MIKGLTEEENKALEAQIANLPKEQQGIARKQVANMPLEELKKLFKPQCIFCSIATGKAKTKKIYENKDTIAFLNIFPASEGHVLVIPKRHAMFLPELTDTEAAELIRTVKWITSAVFEAIKPDGITVLQRNGQAAGQEVPHVHFHVIPRKEGDKIDLQNWQALQPSEQDLVMLQNKIISKLPVHDEFIEAPKKKTNKNELLKFKKKIHP